MIAAKIASELVVYLANFVIQRDFIFRDTRRAATRPRPAKAERGWPPAVASHRAA